MESFYFLAVNDIHFQGEPCRAWLERAVRQMQGHAEQPEFCLLLGDLVEDGSEEELAQAQEIFRGLGVPLHPVIGNHDYAEGDDPSAFDALFPGCRNYRFEHGGWTFLGLDTTAGLAYQETEIPESTLRWVEAELTGIDRMQPLAVLTHFPLGPDVQYRPRNAAALLALFRDHNLRDVLSGHFHGLTERRLGEVLLTTNRCCSFSRENHDGSNVKGYFLCRASGERIERRFVPVDE